MGRTLLPFRPALEGELQTWSEYRRGLRPEDRPFFDILANHARHHADAGSLVARPMLSEVLFFSIALEQQKSIQMLTEKIQTLEELLHSQDFVQSRKVDPSVSSSHDETSLGNKNGAHKNI